MLPSSSTRSLVSQINRPHWGQQWRRKSSVCPGFHFPELSFSCTYIGFLLVFLPSQWVFVLVCLCVCVCTCMRVHACLCACVTKTDMLWIPSFKVYPMLIATLSCSQLVTVLCLFPSLWTSLQTSVHPSPSLFFSFNTPCPPFFPFLSVPCIFNHIPLSPSIHLFRFGTHSALLTSTLLVPQLC